MVASTNRFEGITPEAMSGAGLRVVIYLRKSPSKKDAAEISIDRQRQECRKLCERNRWFVVEEYIDSGKSGSRDIAKRVDFHRMINDAKKGEFKAVVVWDSSRFTRQDPYDGAEYKLSLRKSGVYMESVREGRIDWSTRSGRTMDYMTTEENHAYAVTISENSVDGRDKAINAGFWPHGAIPFGYDRQYYCGGNPVGEVIARANEAVRGKGWRLKLVPNADEAALIKWIYEQFNCGMSLRQIGKALTARGILTPRGGRGGWTAHTVGDVIRNPAHVGDTAIGFNRRWRQKEVTTRSTASTMPNTHPAHVTRQMWNDAQVKLAKLQAKGQENQQRAHRSGINQKSHLSGIIVCGHCGYRCDCKSRTDKQGNRYRYFACSSATKRPKLNCKQWKANESELLPVVQRELLDAIDAEALRAMKPTTPTSTDNSAAEVARLKRDAVELKRKIDKGTENLLLADPAIYPTLAAKLRDWQGELAKLENTIKLTDGANPGELAGWLQWWETTRKTLVTVREGKPDDQLSETETFYRMVAHMNLPVDDIESCLPKKLKEIERNGINQAIADMPIRIEANKLRELLHKLNAKLILHWKPNGNRYHELDFGRLEVEVDEHALSASSNKCSRVRSHDRGLR